MGDHPPLRVAWLDAAGPDADIVVSSRIRVARNVEGFPLKAKLSSAQEGELETILVGAIERSRLAQDITYQALKDKGPIDRRLLFERHLISMEHLKSEGHHGVAHTELGDISVMVNEEDHLRIQVLAAGQQLAALLEKIEALDERLAENVSFAFHPQFGYLTSCPTNVGTGMRISVMLHLPALALSKLIEKVFNAVNKMNLAVRGFYGEATEASGDFYQISNQVTLGKTPDDLLSDLEKTIPKIVNYEREVRRGLMEEDERKILDDKVWRAYGILTSARTLSSEEAMQLLSHVRMGVNLGLLKGIELDTLNELFLVIQPGHLQQLERRSLKPEERDIARATYVRERLLGRSS
ncbi:MAG: protein arginine kinase [Planctomycetota bacterium]